MEYVQDFDDLACSVEQLSRKYSSDGKRIPRIRVEG